jgi:hypothetical protein
MTTGSTKNYRFGQKNNWRRTVWNEVLRRTDGREKVEPILYLSGPEDIDRDIARSKGVPDGNLIAIDRDPDNVTSVRSMQHPAVHGDIQEVLASWPVSRPVCAVLMDFCGGLTMDAVDVYDLLERRPLRNAVMMINMQRGRDAWSNSLRSQIGGKSHDMFDMLTAISTWSYGPEGPPGPVDMGDKHRGLNWLVFHSMDAWQNSAKAGLIDKIRATPGYQDGFEDAIGMAWSGQYFKAADPQFYSYKSGVLTFDSVVCLNPFATLFNSIETDVASAAMDETVEKNHKHRRSTAMARKIAAMLAVRTRRLAS